MKRDLPNMEAGNKNPWQRSTLAKRKKGSACSRQLLSPRESSSSSGTLRLFDFIDFQARITLWSFLDFAVAAGGAVVLVVL